MIGKSFFTDMIKQSLTAGDLARPEEVRPKVSPGLSSD